MPKAKKTTTKKLTKKTRQSADKKTVSKKTEKPKADPKIKSGRYFEAVGRRKTAVARVRVFTQGEKGAFVNGKPFEEYFKGKDLQGIATAPLERMNCLDRFRWLAKIRGGGINSQAEALKHGLARALVLFNSTFRKRLKKAGFLTRDSRMKERKKFGLKRARRAPQWKKR